MKRATIRFRRILSLLLALTIVIGSLAVFVRPTVAAGILTPSTPIAPTDGPVFPNCTEVTKHTCDLQVFLLIDDSSSMLYSDPHRQRFEGVKNVLDILAKEYYLPAVDLKDPNVELPEISVSLIHFNATVLSDASTQWKTIGPNDIADWPAQLKALDADINIELDYRQKQYTDFHKAFEAAGLRAGEKPQTPECPRLVMLFTDGVPNLTGPDLKGDKLSEYMRDLNGIYQKTFSRDNDLLYVTAFGANPAFIKTWNEEYKQEWDQFTKDSDTADPRRILFVQPRELAPRMERIVGAVIGNPVFTLTPTPGSQRQFEAEVPELVESLRLTFYYAVNTRTILSVTGPDGKVIQADDAKATFTGADTSIQVFKINNPAPGKYTIASTAPGGILTQLLTFRQVTPRLISPAQNVLQFTNQQIGIQLLGVDDRPFVILPQMDIQARVTTNANAEDLAFTQGSDTLTTGWMPLTSGKATVDACVTMTDNNQRMYILYNGLVGEIPIDAVDIQTGQSEAVCALDDKDILVPLTLVNERTRQPVVIDTVVEWPGIMAVHPKDAQISRFALDTIGSQSSQYVLRFRPAFPGEVDFKVTAASVIDEKITEFYDEIITTPGIQAPRRLAFTLQEYSTLGDLLSVKFYRWFHPFCPDRRPVILIGRRLFGLFGPTQVQISSRYFDTGSSATEPGIERFSVQLVSFSDGKSSEPASNWTPLDTGDGSRMVQIPSPGLGFYQVVVNPPGGSSGCAVLAGLPATQTVLLIGDFWEYLIILALIILLALGAFLLHRRYRDRPNLLLVALPIALLIVDAFLVNALITNTFKCQFNCSYLVDRSILDDYPADNELSFCRGVALPFEDFTVIPSFTLGPASFPGVKIPRTSFFGWSFGPITIIPAFTIGPFYIPGWTIGAKFIPILPALRVIDPPLEILRRVISWGIVLIFVVASLILGNIVTRIKGFIEALKDPKGRFVILTNISIWLFFFVVFCSLFYTRVVR